MKTRIASAIAPAMIAALIALTSCQKTPLENLSGSYTYKTSGVVGVVPTQIIGTGLPMDTTWVALYPEQGQINIVTKDAWSSTVIVTWNDLTGNACSTEAKVDGNNLTLAPNTKTVKLTDGSETIGGGIVRFSGDGMLYDNMLIIPMTYQGAFELSGHSMTVVSSKVECIAKAN